MLQDFGTNYHIKLAAPKMGESIFLEINNDVGRPVEIDADHFGANDFFQSVKVAADVKDSFSLSDFLRKRVGDELSPAFAVGKRGVALLERHYVILTGSETL